MLNRYDRLPLLKMGKNIIVIEGTDGGALPCGILGGVQIDGKFTATGTAWKTKVVEYQANPDYSDPEMVSNWQNAHIVAPLGSGAWGSKLKVKKSADKVL